MFDGITTQFIHYDEEIPRGVNHLVVGVTRRIGFSVQPREPEHRSHLSIRGGSKEGMYLDAPEQFRLGAYTSFDYLVHDHSQIILAVRNLVGALDKIVELEAILDPFDSRKVR